MTHSNHSKPQVSYGPCPPEEFSGRFKERRSLKEILKEVKHRGHIVMLSGARGSGKTSFLDWIEWEIQNELKSPAIKNAFLETPGMIFTTYRGMLTKLKGYQKFDWFRKAVNSTAVTKSIDVVLNILEKFSPAAGGISAVRRLLPSEPVEYSQLASSFLKVFHNLSDVMTAKDQFLAILCDDVQWSSEADFHLLKDLVRNVPPGVVFFITFRLESGNVQKYVELRQELDRFGHTEVRLSAMSGEEIKEFAELRYKVSIDDATAHFLSLNIGDPFCLVGCFNLLQNRDLVPTLVNVQKMLPEAVDPARCIYAGLDRNWKDRVDSLCILHPPLLLSFIGCMLRKEKHEIARLQEELDQSVVFRKLEKESYDFAHPSVREYRRKELPQSLAVELHSRAVDCFETSKDQFDDLVYELSLAEHLFFGHQYERALELSYRLSGWLHDHFDYGLALEMAERSIICAEKIGDNHMLASAFHRKGMVLSSTFSFSEALNAYNQSLEIKREIGDRVGEAATLHEIGMVYQDMNRFEEALNYYNQSLEKKREIGDRVGEAATLHEIGMVYQDMNRFEEALNYYNQSLEIEREISDRASEAKTLHEIGTVMKKSHIGVVLIGHVDHGKSTLGGRLLFDCNQIDPYIIERYRKKAAAIGKKTFEFAWVMDTLPEERERGLTIKTQIRDLCTDRYFLTLIDAPGHENFIKNMILGTREADAAVLVVSANEGIQEQTREHVYIAKSLGIEQMIVVINKMDITTPPYSQARYDEVVKDVDELMKTAGFEEYEFVPASAYEGDNIVTPSENLGWYKGDTVFTMLDTFRVPKRQTDLPLRWPIQDKYRIDSISYIPVGKVETGVIKPGDTIVFMPPNKRAQVKTIEMHRKRIERGIPGDNIGVDVRTIDGWSLKDWVKKGDVAGPVDSPPTVAKRFTARIVIFYAGEIYRKGKEEKEKRYYPPKIRVGFRPSIHCHTARVTCRVVELLAKINGSSGEILEKNPEYISDGDSALVIFEPEKPLVIEIASDFPKLGRFAIRDSNRTIGAGMCLGVEEM